MLDEIRCDALGDVGEHSAGGHLGAEIEESLVRVEEEVGVENFMAEGASVGGADGGSVPAGTEKDVVKSTVCGREDGRLRGDLVKPVERGRALGVGVVAVEGERVVGADLDLGVAMGVTAIVKEIVRVGLE